MLYTQKILQEYGFLNTMECYMLHVSIKIADGNVGAILKTLISSKWPIYIPFQVFNV